jgi:hypothetical protein
MVIDDGRTVVDLGDDCDQQEGKKRTEYSTRLQALIEGMSASLTLRNTGQDNKTAIRKPSY